MSGGWGDRFDPPCKKTDPHPRHTWGTGTCPGIADPNGAVPNMADPVMRGAITYGYLAAKTQATRLLRRYAEQHQHEGTYDGVCRAAALIDRMEPDRG